MQPVENSKRRYFSKSQKLKVLNELGSDVISLSELARKHRIHPVTLYQWKRIMGSKPDEKEVDIQELIEENQRL